MCVHVRASFALRNASSRKLVTSGNHYTFVAVPGYNRVVISDGAPRLSSLETAVLSWADRLDRTSLTTADIESIVGAANGRHVASSLAHKGLLQRLSKGVYRVQPLGAIGRSRSGSAIAAVALVLGDRLYYVGGRTAASLHRLTTQRYATVVDVYTPRRLRPRRVGQAELVIHPVAMDALQFGLTHMTIDDVAVVVSDPERTFLDLLDRSERLLGFSETRRILHDNLGHKLRAARLVNYVRHWPKTSTARRLGVLLEREGVTDETLAPLIRSLRGSASDAALVPGGTRRGALHPRFRVILNDQPAEVDDSSA